MTTSQKWGRKESLIWPPRGFYYSYGAVFLAIVFTGFLLFLRFQFGLKPLERYYLPYYVRSAYSIRPTAKYQLLYLSNGKQSRPAVVEDVEDGTTVQPSGKPIPLTASANAARQGYRRLLREPEHTYQNKPLHAFFAQNIYQGQNIWQMFSMQVYFGILALLLQLPFTLPKDIKRRKELRYGRRLKGPNLVSAREFNEAIQGDGIGIKTDDMASLLSIPASAENKHILAIGDTGSGKSSVIRQFAFRIQQRGECAIIYDPAGEFIRQFYDEKRGDVVLNPLDVRMPYWNPADEVDDEPEALTLAKSFYQPDDVPNVFFVESPQKIFAYLISRDPKPAPEDLIEWMASKDKIEARLEGTEHSILVDRTAGPQRVGVLSSLNKIATTLRMLPTAADAAYRQWSVRAWCEKRDGWIFLTSTTKTREAVLPLHCVWLDMLILHLLGSRNKNQKRVWFLIDEMASLQRLPQLHTALTENRKSENPVVLGFQGRSQLETRYGHDAEAMLSQPATKIFFRTDEPQAAKWISDNLVHAARERAQHLDIPANTAQRAQEAITFARSKNFEREAVVDERLLMRDALRRAMGEVPYAQVRGNLESRHAAGEFVTIAGGLHQTGRQLTTAQTIATENQIVRRMREGQNQVEPVLSRRDALALTEQHSHLNRGQQEVVKEVLTSRDQVQGIQGVAGAGKTTALVAVRTGAEFAGYQVEGLAPTSRAAKQLEEAGIHAGTLQGFLARGPQCQDGPERRLYFVDESSLASTNQMRDFLNRLGSQDRVILIGDTRQHQAVEAGRPFQQLQEAGMHTAKLDQIVRQKDPELKAVVELLSVGNVAGGLEALQNQGRITEIRNTHACYGRARRR